MNAKRRRLIEGTEVLWSTLIYVPVVLFGILTLSVVEPLATPYLDEPKPAPAALVYGLIGLMVIFGPMLVRSRVWQPLRALARDCGNKTVFRAYCLHIFRQAYPFIPLLAVPAVLLCLEIGGWFFYLQLGVIVLADHFIEKWRAGPIKAAVDGLMKE